MKAFVILMMGLLLTACTTVQIEPTAIPDPKNVYKEYYDRWFLGVFRDDLPQFGQACPNGKYAIVKSYFSLEDLMITAITVGIYSPSTFEIVCAASQLNNAALNAR